MTNSHDVKIIPSVLPADFSRLGQECTDLESAGVDAIQFDVMDGQFVPNLTFGADTIASVRDKVSVEFEAHLMIETPDQFIQNFVDAGCQTLIVHAEACAHLHRTIHKIKEAGAKAGVALNPHTPIEMVENVAVDLDMLLVMTVNPGFGGQKYIELGPKLDKARALSNATSNFEIEVDGGINAETIKHAAAHGANMFISGSTLYKHPEGLAACVKELREAAEASIDLTHGTDPSCC